MCQEFDQKLTFSKASTSENHLNDSKGEFMNDLLGEQVENFPSNEFSTVDQSSEISSCDNLSLLCQKYPDLLAIVLGLILILFLIILTIWYCKLDKKLSNPEIDIGQYVDIGRYLLIFSMAFLMVLLVFDVLFYFDILQYCINDNPLSRYDRHYYPSFYCNNDQSDYCNNYRSDYCNNYRSDYCNNYRSDYDTDSSSFDLYNLYMPYGLMNPLQFAWLEI